MVNVVFTSYAFPVTGSTASKTLPFRLNYKLNVKDFGAKGNGVDDDTDAIKSCIEYAVTLGGNAVGATPSQYGSTIFFPPGIYLITKGGTTRMSLEADTATIPSGHITATTFWEGCGSDVSIVRGTWEVPGSHYEDVPNGFMLIGLSGQQFVGMRNMGIENLSTHVQSGCVLTEGVVTFEHCRFLGASGAYNQVGTFGGYFKNCRFISIRPITEASAGASRSPYFTDSKFPEASVSTPAAISNAIWNGGTLKATATTTAPHGLYVGGIFNLNLVTSNHAWTPSGSGTETVQCTITGASTFTYTLNADPGAWGTGTWSYSHSNVDVTAGLWTSTPVINCYAEGFDIGFSIGWFPLCVANKASRCGVGFLHAGVNGTPTGSGDVGGPGIGPAEYASMFSRPVNAVCGGNIADRCQWGVYHTITTGGTYAATSIVGDTGPTTPSTIDTITWAGGTATATTHVAHNLPGGTSDLVLVTNTTNWTPGNTGNEIVTCTNTGASTFTYALGAAGTGTGSGTWNYPIEYGITSTFTRFSIIAANSIACIASKASFDIDHAESLVGHSGLTGQSIAMAMRGPYGWNIADSFSGVKPGTWKFIQCGASSAVYPDPGVVFTAIPPAGPFGLFGLGEGLEMVITDCPITALGNTVAAGGGANRYVLRYNGTSWIRMI